MQNLFETNFMLTLKKVLTTGVVHKAYNTSDELIIGSVGEVYRVTPDSMLLLQSSEITSDMLEKIRECANLTIRKMNNDNWKTIHCICKMYETWFSFVQVDDTLNMVGYTQSYDMIRHHIKPILECFFILNGTAKIAGLKCGEINIIAGESFIREEDESIAMELLRRFGYISDIDTIKRLYICPDHKKNHQDVIHDINNMISKLDELESINLSDNRDFSNIQIPANSIESLKDMSIDEVKAFISDARGSFEKNRENIKMMDSTVESNLEFFNHIVSGSDTATLELNMSERNIIETVRTENYCALPAILP